MRTAIEVPLVAELDDDDSGNPFGQIEVITLDDRKTAWVRENRIVAFIALGDGGPSRLLFDRGGYLDVCGSAEIFRREARIIELKQEKRNAP